MCAEAVDVTLAPGAGAGGEVASVANPGRSCHLSLVVIFCQQQWLGVPLPGQLSWVIPSPELHSPGSSSTQRASGKPQPRVRRFPFCGFLAFSSSAELGDPDIISML